jgi:methylase of polypeptide subunit release factors
VFADITQACIDLSLTNAARFRGSLSPAHALAFACEGFVGDMFDAVSCNTMLSGGRERLKNQCPFDVILFNPPQTGGHDAFRASCHALGKYGGEDGTLYYRRFAREVGSLAHDETACVLAQIGLANPARVERALRSAGFDSVTELARQQRTTTVRDRAATS